MAENTQADLPKKNAAPAEAPKSLQSTIQNVITKAITSPTDGKVDFAQGVNHITGDPQQKSAGAPDAMQSLKAEMQPKKDMNASYDDMKKETEDKEKEMKEMSDKEKEMKKEADDKKKEDMKEGEMPAGLKKYLDKKNDKKEEKEDEKKDVKEMEDKKSEMIKAEIDKMKKEMEDKEKELKAQVDKEKEMNEAEHKDDKEKKEEKEDEKKKMSEAEDKEKEMKKEMQHDAEKKTAKEKVKDMNMKEDVKALTADEDLSEEFKQKAATIFESAVIAKLVEEIEKLESEYETKVEEKTEEVKSEIVEKVDAYLNYVVSEWTKENELAIEKGLRTEIAEDFIGGLKNLFESHYIEIPEEKYNVIENQAAEIEELKGKLNESMETTVELNQKIGEFARDEILVDVASDLAETEKDKFKGLADSIEYKDAADFRTKVETVKESYFPKKKVVSEDETNDVADKPVSDLSGSMAAYAAAISKITNKK
jgi:DNA repair exonuclease SbcCD ATPase subunit